MIVLSIVVDIGRSRALMVAAKQHQSQALEADAIAALVVHAETLMAE